MRAKKSRLIILIFILSFFILFIFAKCIFTPARIAKLVAPRLAKVLGIPLTLEKIKIKNSFIQLEGIKIQEPRFSLKVKNLLLQPGLLDLIRKRKIKTILLENPILQIIPATGKESVRKRSEFSKEINEGDLPQSIKIVKGEIVFLREKERIEISDLTAEINEISSVLPWNWKIKGSSGDTHFSFAGKINPLKKEGPADLQLVFETLPIPSSRKTPFAFLQGKVRLSGKTRERLNLYGDLRITSSKANRGKIKIVGYLKNKTSFNGKIDLKKINLAIPDYPFFENFNGSFEIVKNSIMESPITLEKIDYHQLEFYNIKGRVSYERDEDSLKIKDFTYHLCQGKGKGNLEIKELLSGKNRYLFSTEISDFNLENFCQSYKEAGLISGILECRFKMKGTKEIFPEISASFFTVKKPEVKQTISFRAIEKISFLTGSSFIKKRLTDYPYRKLAGSFQIKDGYFTLRGDIKKGGKQYLLLGPFFGQSINILIDPKQNTISLNDLKMRLKRVLEISPQVASIGSNKN